MLHSVSDSLFGRFFGHLFRLETVPWAPNINMLYSHGKTICIHIYAETYSTIMTNEHTSLEKYTSHTLLGCQRVVCERWVGDGTDCNIVTPGSSVFSSTSFSFCWAAQPGVTEGRKPSVLSWFYTTTRTTTRTPTNWLQLTQAVSGTRLYNCLTSTCFLWALHRHRIQPVNRSRWYLRPDAPVSRLTARSKVNMLLI